MTSNEARSAAGLAAPGLREESTPEGNGATPGQPKKMITMSATAATAATAAGAPAPVHDGAAIAALACGFLFPPAAIVLGHVSGHAPLGGQPCTWSTAQ